MAPGRAVLVVAADRFEARVFEARLRSEGIDVQLRGPLDDPYVFTLGGHAHVEVLVRLEQLGDARFVLLADEVDDVLVGVDQGAHDDLPHEPGAARRWAAAACCGLLIVVPLARTVAALAA
jgi:hypothetical protein